MNAQVVQDLEAFPALPVSRQPAKSKKPSFSQVVQQMSVLSLAIPNETPITKEAKYSDVVLSNEAYETESTTSGGSDSSESFSVSGSECENGDNIRWDLMREMMAEIDRERSNTESSPIEVIDVKIDLQGVGRVPSGFEEVPRAPPGLEGAPARLEGVPCPPPGLDGAPRAPPGLDGAPRAPPGLEQPCKAPPGLEADDKGMTYSRDMLLSMRFVSGNALTAPYRTMKVGESKCARAPWKRRQS